ncbi:MAG TPA: head-tail adaptor protein [Verrucomicrobiota bacterium]|mgnify:CR=1 FL=1|nr:head-tail adaptor protein [Verrucomicrobiota bacterium]
MSALLPSDELAALRATQEAALPDTAAIRRITRTSDGAGGHTESEATVTTVACRMAQIGNGSERLIAERLSLAESVVVTMPYGTDVRLTDRLLISGVTWEVVAILERSWSTALRVIAARVQ